MAPDIEPVSCDDNLPPHADVVIIGGGIIGVSTAFFLAERGIPVVLVEKGRIAGEQSGRNWGWVRQAHRDPREFDLIRESLGIWRGLDARIGARTGFETTGILFAAHDETTEDEYRVWVAHAATAGIAADVVRGAELARLLPGDTAGPRAALHCPSDGRAEPERATPALANAARQLGARLLIGCAARGIERAAGRVQAVVTERGTIRCSSVVVAGGAWSRRLLKDVDIDLPQLKVLSSVARTSPVPDAPAAALWDDLFAFRRRADGGYTIANGRVTVVPLTPDSFRLAAAFAPALRLNWRAIRPRLDRRFGEELREAARVPFDRPSPYERVRTLDPEPHADHLAAAFRALATRFPAFAAARVLNSWGGYIDSTPDLVPVISAADSVPGLYVASGFSGHGFGIGPAAGQLVADLVTGAAPLVDPTAFRLGRYSDGSNPRPTMGL